MTNVASIPPGDLPRVTAREAATLTRAAGCLAAVPRRVTCELGALGSVGVTSEGVSSIGAAPAGEANGDVVLGISRGAEPGRLVLDGAFARRVLARALGDGEPAPVGVPLARLSLGERGVVAGLVASVLHALGDSFSVSLVAPAIAAVVKDGAVAIGLALTAADAAGWARLEVPASWLAVATPANASALAALTVEVRVELARTSVAARELAGVAPGDAVVFDGEPAFAGGAREVRVVVGAYAARARLDELEDEGRVTLGEALRLAPARAHPVSMNDATKLKEAEVKEVKDVNGVKDVQNDGGDGDRRNESTDATTLLAAAPIEVVAELGRLTLRGDEVVALGPGAVIALGRVGAAPVALRVGGEIWAEGELVEIDGALGVRVTASRRSGFPTR